MGVLRILERCVASINTRGEQQQHQGEGDHDEERMTRNGKLYRKVTAAEIYICNANNVSVITTYKAVDLPSSGLMSRESPLGLDGERTREYEEACTLPK